MFKFQHFLANIKRLHGLYLQKIPHIFPSAPGGCLPTSVFSWFSWCWGSNNEFHILGQDKPSTTELDPHSSGLSLKVLSWVFWVDFGVPGRELSGFPAAFIRMSPYTSVICCSRYPVLQATRRQNLRHGSYIAGVTNHGEGETATALSTVLCSNQIHVAMTK